MFHIINWSIFMNQKSSKLFLWVIFFLVVPQPQMNSMYNDITIVDAEPTFDLTFGNIAIGAAKMGGILLGTAALNALVGYSTQRLASYMQKIDPTRSKVESKIQTIKKKGSFVPKHTPVWNWMKFIKGNKTSPEGWKSLLSFEKDKIDPFGVEDIKGFLLYGDPGVGKTALAKAFAYEIGAPFKEISATNFTTRVLVGTGVLGVQDFFDEVEKVASEHGEIVVLIDEADSLFKRVENEHNHYDNSANNELLKRIDNLHKGVRLFFATNNINNMDRALYRDGRIVPLKVEHPDLKNRLKALKFHATDGRCIYSSAFDFLTILADFTDNFTFAELGELVKDASRYAGQMSYETGARAITQESLRKALLNRFLSKKQKLDGALDDNMKKWAQFGFDADSDHSKENEQEKIKEEKSDSSQGKGKEKIKEGEEINKRNTVKEDLKLRQEKLLKGINILSETIEALNKYECTGHRLCKNEEILGEPRIIKGRSWIRRFYTKFNSSSYIKYPVYAFGLYGLYSYRNVYSPYLSNLTQNIWNAEFWNKTAISLPISLAQAFLPSKRQMQ